MLRNYSSKSEEDLADLLSEVGRHRGLRDVLAWAAIKPKVEMHPQIVAEVVTQDEYRHDVIVPYQNIFLVYDTT